jgi:hypothetical protein
VLNGYAQATRPLSCGALVGAGEHADEQGGDHRGRAGRGAAVPGERFLIVGGQCAAKRSNMVGVPFFLVRASGEEFKSSVPAAGVREPAWIPLRWRAVRRWGGGLVRLEPNPG